MHIKVHCAAGAVSQSGRIMMVAGALSQVGSQRLQHLPKIARHVCANISTIN